MLPPPLLAVLGAVAIGLAGAATAAAAASKKNVLFVVVDDLGFDDVGFRSGQIHTPTIDALADRGVVLDQYYVQDVCSPSRATFMTGRYAMHHSVVDWIPPASSYGLPLNETTMAEKFKEAGYKTHASGKWHLGFYKWEFTPTFRGFDSFLGFYSGGEDYFTHESSGGYDFRRDTSPRCGKGCSEIDWQDKGKYSTTVFTREAVRVVEEHDTSDPLFLYLAYQGVHSPPQVPEKYIAPYKDLIADPKRRTFAGMLSAVDEGIANVTAALKRRGMLENTLIIFTSDNGGPTTTTDGVGARNWPLKGGKHSVWEGGVRATAFVSGAGVTPQSTPYKGLMHGADWLPTLSKVAGYNLSGTLPLDGVSPWNEIRSSGNLSPRTAVVLGNSTDKCSWEEGDPRRAIYEGMPQAEVLGCGFAIRDAQWKLIQGYGGSPDGTCNSTSSGPRCRNESDVSPSRKECPEGWSLFNVEEDPLELHEVSSEHPDVLKHMQGKMARILTSYHQYEIDPSCPPHTWVHDSHVGNTWEPWC